MSKFIILVVGTVFLLAGCSIHHKCGCHEHPHHKHSMKGQSVAKH